MQDLRILLERASKHVRIGALLRLLYGASTGSTQKLGVGESGVGRPQRIIVVVEFLDQQGARGLTQRLLGV